jgi:hypothetical protein
MQDFPSALESAWNADPTLAAAGLTPLYGDVAPPGGTYPYAVLAVLGGRVILRNFTRTAVDEDHYRVNVYATTRDGAAALGAVATAFLDGLQDVPLAFDAGTQVDFHRTGDTLMRLPRAGAGGVPFVWVFSTTYLARVARTRP